MERVSAAHKVIGQPCGVEKRSWKSGRGKTEICFSTWNQKIRVYGKLPRSGGFSCFQG